MNCSQAQGPREGKSQPQRSVGNKTTGSNTGKEAGQGQTQASRDAIRGRATPKGLRESPRCRSNRSFPSCPSQQPSPRAKPTSRTSLPSKLPLRSDFPAMPTTSAHTLALRLQAHTVPKVQWLCGSNPVPHDLRDNNSLGRRR